VPQNRGGDALRKRKTLGHGTASPNNRNDLSNNLRFANGKVIVMNRIAPGDHRIAMDVRDAMGNELLLSVKEQDLSTLQILDRAVPDAENIARPNRG